MHTAQPPERPTAVRLRSRLRRSRARIAATLAALLVGVAGASGGARAAAGDPAAYSEDDVKAAFLFHFATYVEWPDHEDDGSITFAVLAAPGVADRLERFTGERRVNEQPVQVRRLGGVEELSEEIEVLYIGPSENTRLEQLLARIDGPVLTVTDVPGDPPEGAMINFQLIDQRVRFVIALATAERAGLSLSSRLLGAALRVNTTHCYLDCRQLDPTEEAHLIAARAVGLDAQNLQSSRASTLLSISLPSPNSG